MTPIDHPRTVPSHPWLAHRGGVRIPPSIVGNVQIGPEPLGGFIKVPHVIKPSPRTFAPCAHYSPTGEQLKVYWGDQPAYADEVDGRRRVTLLRANFCPDLLQGVKIWGIPEILNLKGRDGYVECRMSTLDPLHFKPFAYYDARQDALLIRWLPGTDVVEIDDDQYGHPMTMILSTVREPEDPPEMKPWLLVGVRIGMLSLIVPIAS